MIIGTPYIVHLSWKHPTDAGVRNRTILVYAANRVDAEREARDHLDRTYKTLYPKTTPRNHAQWIYKAEATDTIVSQTLKAQTHRNTQN